MQDFRKLRVWQDGQQLAADIHAVTADMSDAGAFRSQVRRSSQSIGANIAEGARSDSRRRFAHFLQMAIGSASETESHLDFARRRGLLALPVLNQLEADLIRIRRQMISLRKKVLEAEESSKRDTKLDPDTQTRN